MMNDNVKKILIVFGTVALVCVILYFAARSSRSPNVESFDGQLAGSMTNVGSIETNVALHPSSEDSNLPSAINFADMVNEDPQTLGTAPPSSAPSKPMDRLSRQQGSALMPRIAGDATPFNVDLADPRAAIYQVKGPNVVTALRSRYQETGLRHAIDGDIAIRHYPNVSLIAKSHIGSEALNVSGIHQYNGIGEYSTLTGGGFKNLPQYTAGAGQASGYMGVSSGVIMDM